jgi:transcription antitermination factor NusG
VKLVGEQLTVKKEMQVGSRVNITSGTHQGLKGQIMAMAKQSDPQQFCVVVLDISGSMVEVKRKRLELVLRERSRTPES